MAKNTNSNLIVKILIGLILIVVVFYYFFYARNVNEGFVEGIDTSGNTIKITPVSGNDTSGNTIKINPVSGNTLPSTPISIVQNKNITENCDIIIKGANYIIIEATKIKTEMTNKRPDTNNITDYTKNIDKTINDKTSGLGVYLTTIKNNLPK
jgi:hypothetical protein